MTITAQPKTSIPAPNTLPAQSSTGVINEAIASVSGAEVIAPSSIPSVVSPSSNIPTAITPEDATPINPPCE